MASFDVIVVGAGPAGMTAAMYTARAGLSTAFFETLMPGGQMGLTDTIENYPGFPQGIQGFQLSFDMKEQAERFGAQYINANVIGLELGHMGSPHIVVAEGEERHAAKSVIIATGARSRKLGVEGEEEYAGRGVSYCATCDGGFFRDKTTMVVGGGNTAAADVVYLSRICPKVHLVHRRDQLRATVAEQRAIANAGDKVAYEWNSVVKRIIGTDGMVTAAELEDVNTHELHIVPTSAVFVAVGKVPNTEPFVDVLPLDPGGYVIADENGVTELPGIFAAGDVRTKRLRQVATAVSDGAAAAESAAEWLAVR